MHLISASYSAHLKRKGKNVINGKEEMNNTLTSSFESGPA